MSSCASLKDTKMQYKYNADKTVAYFHKTVEPIKDCPSHWKSACDKNGQYAGRSLKKTQLTLLRFRNKLNKLAEANNLDERFKVYSGKGDEAEYLKFVLRHATEFDNLPDVIAYLCHGRDSRKSAKKSKKSSRRLKAGSGSIKVTKREQALDMTIAACRRCIDAPED